MIEPELPDEEEERLTTLHALRILDTAPEERFDRLTRMARRMFDVPISLVSIVDSKRQWFKSVYGLEAKETPRNISFCGHAILGDETFLVPDALEDERFHDNPLVADTPSIRFYAACPLKMANGHTVGTLCLIDTVPRELSEEDETLLQDLAAMAEQELAAIQLATLDELTMISNRRGFESLAQNALDMCIRNQKPATLVIFDLDDFKSINDTFGHAEGDRALVAFANLLKEVFRESDLFARIGGDEFVALLTGTDNDEVDRTLTRFSEAVEQYNKEQNCGYDLCYSAGYVSDTPHDDFDLTELMGEADKRMYEIKQQKKVI